MAARSSGDRPRSLDVVAIGRHGCNAVASERYTRWEARAREWEPGVSGPPPQRDTTERATLLLGLALVRGELPAAARLVAVGLRRVLREIARRPRACRGRHGAAGAAG